MSELCETVSEGRTTFQKMCGVYVIKRGHAKNITIKFVHLNSHTLYCLLVNNEYAICALCEERIRTSAL